MESIWVLNSGACTEFADEAVAQVEIGDCSCTMNQSIIPRYDIDPVSQLMEIPAGRVVVAISGINSVGMETTGVFWKATA